jgi:hypothetical protein
MFGIWDDAGTKPGTINFDHWLTLKVAAEAPTRGQITVDVSPDLDWTTVAVAAPGPDDRTLVLVDRFEGTAGVVDKVETLNKSLAEVVEVALTPTAHIFSAKLTEAKVEHKVLTTADTGRACSAFQIAVKAGTVAHVDQDDLNTSVKNAVARYVGDNQHWDRRERLIDISPIVAGSTAAHRWALLTAAPDVPPAPARRARPKLRTVDQMCF